MLLVRQMKLIYMDCEFCPYKLTNWRYVEEATNAFEIRIQACQQRGENHLHVYFSNI